MFSRNYFSIISIFSGANLRREVIELAKLLAITFKGQIREFTDIIRIVSEPVIIEIGKTENWWYLYLSEKVLRCTYFFNPIRSYINSDYEDFKVEDIKYRTSEFITIHGENWNCKSYCYSRDFYLDPKLKPRQILQFIFKIL